MNWEEWVEWKGEITTPGLQEYDSGAIDLDVLRKRLVKGGNPAPARYLPALTDASPRRQSAGAQLLASQVPFASPSTTSIAFM
ncbi:hypothetical protein HXP44_12535 [Streptomyces sioyaensis]|uniref:Uncharacterized protein n=1 Tax=Streptomyces sioyaensis TaxID=67364 RepID=A0A4Q1QYY0_9ACTN|nr:hypothetical protein [Streptomyces sioyaensis]MBM4792855.1 hypothetical protein [Streptomyces sioyaensis]RXS65141.1 hypothetical protein EST54_19855 [Streptomyces sioyaensis]